MSEGYGNVSSLRILAGSGHSGTTCLLDVLCEASNLHPIVEPLHPLPLEDVIDAQKHVLFYEQLANHDSRKWRTLLDCLGLDITPKLAVPQCPTRQSTQVMGRSMSKQSVSVLDRLRPENKAGIKRVPDHLGVTFYHTVSLADARPTNEQPAVKRKLAAALEI